MMRELRNSVLRKQMGNKGLTLVEMMIASVVLAVGILGLMSAISSTMVVDAVTEESNLALDTARRVMEQVKSEGYEALSAKVYVDPGPDYIYTPPVNTWYGTLLYGAYGQYGEGGGQQIEVDANGDFNAVSGIGALRTRILDPWDGDVDGKVGNVTVNQDQADVLEVVITMQWKGIRGNTERILRCQLADWGI